MAAKMSVQGLRLFLVFISQVCTRGVTPTKLFVEQPLALHGSANYIYPFLWTVVFFCPLLKAGIGKKEVEIPYRHSHGNLLLSLR